MLLKWRGWEGGVRLRADGKYIQALRRPGGVTRTDDSETVAEGQK